MQIIRSRLQAIDARLSQHARYRIARTSYQTLNRRDGQRKAAAMTYFAVFSIFPFVMVLIAFLSFLISSKEAQARVMSLLADFLPAGQTGAQQVIGGVISGRGVAGGFGIVLLLWGALGWFEAIDRSVNEMWGVEVRRSFVKDKLFALAMISGIALVMLISWGANVTVNVAKGLASSQGMNLLPGATALWELVVWAITVGLMLVMFMLLYRFSPMCRLSWGEVWRGALITAILWSVVRSAFAIYVTHFANYSSVYGPLGAVMALLVWLYLAHMIILYGAGLTYAIRLEEHGIREPNDVPCAVPESPPSREYQQPADRGGPAA